VTHYEALGVAPDAPADEIRRAYLRLARAHHPDRHAATATPATSDDAERRMRDINAAWAVLGDPAKRAEYDRRTNGTPASGMATARTHQPSTEFRPRFEVDEDDDDTWRYEPDEFDPDTALGRLLGAGPPLLLVVGLGLLAVSLVVQQRELTAAAFACLLFAGVLFISAPLVAVLKSRSTEQRRARPPTRDR
jgi:hypothetical protein